MIVFSSLKVFTFFLKFLFRFNPSIYSSLKTKIIKQLQLIVLFLLASFSESVAQQYKVITAVESIVPGGVGRSRILDSKEEVDYKKFTTAREDGKDSDQRKIDRGDAKIDNLEETKLLNFYSMMGINFQNIASNDALLSSKLSEIRLTLTWPE